MWHVTCRKCFSIYYILLHGKYPKWQCPSPTHFEVFMFRIDLSCAPTRFHICHHEASANRPLWKGGSKYLTWPCAYEVPKRGRQAVGTHMHPACLWCSRSNKQRFVYLPVDILSLKILWQLLKCCFLLFFGGGGPQRLQVWRPAIGRQHKKPIDDIQLTPVLCSCAIRRNHIGSVALTKPEIVGS